MEGLDHLLECVYFFCHTPEQAKLIRWNTEEPLKVIAIDSDAQRLLDAEA